MQIVLGTILLTIAVFLLEFGESVEVFEENGHVFHFYKDHGDGIISYGEIPLLGGVEPISLRIYTDRVLYFEQSVNGKRDMKRVLKQELKQIRAVPRAERRRRVQEAQVQQAQVQQAQVQQPQVPLPAHPLLQWQQEPPRASLQRMRK
ncbi:uncharacterized protein LOC117181053 [Belonocnema kinseyi]|uniref:uncharacterized protein LOC117181053 n=1 Tax=Belonocnema kinseyi TaxID=2817044 RepID=UPI00143DA69D|nr:uncharacterized protein LOC117181053 [Belonocnema kinseyi]